MSASDLVDIINEAGEVTGQASREEAHRKGLLHRVVNVWFVTSDDKVIFQCRSQDKDTYPGKLDATVGGHVDAGDDALVAALRETSEETGLHLTTHDLIKLPQATGPAQGEAASHFHEVFMYRFTGQLEDLKVETGESQGFEAWAIGDLVSLPVDQRSQFIFDVIGHPYPEIFARMALRNHHLPYPYYVQDSEVGVYFWQDVELSLLPLELQLASISYFRSTRPHCSLITLREIIPVLVERDHLTPGEALYKASRAVIAAIEKFRPRVIRYKPEFRIADKPETGSRTIVVMVELEHNDEFRQSITKSLNIEIPPRPAHVTLYTLENGKPIGLASQAQLDQYSRPLSDYELKELKDRLPLKQFLESRP